MFLLYVYISNIQLLYIRIITTRLQSPASSI